MLETVRLAHVSDVHLHRWLRFRRTGDLAHKRLAGLAAGIVTGRRRHFRRAAFMLEALARDLGYRRHDALVFSGDATTLALPDEFEAAAEALSVGTRQGMAVPGNHDRYVRQAHGLFEQHFHPWQQGTRLPGHDYPFAMRVGPIWLIGLDSARPNWNVTDSTGALGADQLDRLRELCGQLAPGPRLIVTHYPLARANGTPEGWRRRLVDWADAVRAARECEIVAWVHGHIHTGFVAFPTAQLPLIRLCAGSATQHNRLTYSEYAITAKGLTGTRRQYHARLKRFRPLETFQVGW